MATGQMTYKPLMTEEFTASGAITKRRFVGYDGAQISAEGTKARGVSLFDVDTTRIGTIITRGTVLVEACGAIAIGDAVGSDADGKAKKAAEILVDIGGTVLPGNLLISIVQGYAKEAAAEDEDVIEVDLVK